MNGLRAFGKGFKGNVLGEGFVLGGVFVLGREQQVQLTQFSPCVIKSGTTHGSFFFFSPQGILLEHREIEFGDKVNIEDVIQAVRRIPQELVPMENVTE